MLSPKIKIATSFLFYTSKKLCVLSIVLLLTSCTSESDALIPTEQESTFSTTISFSKNTEMENQLFELVNAHRYSIGKRPFQRYPQADQKAFEHTLYMLEVNQLNHDNYTQRRFYFISLGFTGLKENVAKGYETPEALLNAWLNSEPHKNGLESDSLLTGISILKNDAGIVFFTQLYLK